MRKAQVSQNMVIFALALAIVAFIIIFGYRSTKILNQKGEQTKLILLEKELKSDVETIDYGSVKIQSYDVPADVKKICFYSEGNDNNPLTCTDCPKSSDYPIVADAVADNTSYNVFILREELPYTMELDKVAIGCCEFYCFDKKDGKIELKIEGKGKKTLVS